MLLHSWLTGLQIFWKTKQPKPPVIKAFSIEPDVYHAFNSILGAQKDDITLVQAYLQIILARCIPKFQLVEKGSVGSTDLIYRTVSYVSGNFKHSITLESMAEIWASANMFCQGIF